MVEVKFFKTRVSIYVEGKKFSSYVLNGYTYGKIFNDIVDSSYDDYRVSQHGVEKFSCSTWKELSKFLAQFCDA